MSNLHRLSTLKRYGKDELFHPEQSDLNKFLSGIKTFYKSRIENIDINYNFEGNNTQNCNYNFDKVLLKQAIFNLIQNSIESINDSYRENGSIDIKLVLNNENMAEISIIDNGKGGGPQKLDKVLSYMSDSPDGGIDNGKNQKEAQSTV